MERTQVASINLDEVRSSLRHLSDATRARVRHQLQLIWRASGHSHWLATRIGSELFEMQDYRESLLWNDREVRLCPKCPLVQWDRAGALFALGKTQKAVHIWSQLLKQGTRAIAFGQCGERLSWTASLVNDSRFRLADAMLMNQPEQSYKLISAHLPRRRRGIASIYSLKEAQHIQTKALGLTGRVRKKAASTSG